MNFVLAHDTARLLMAERQQFAARQARARNLLAVRRWQRRKEVAEQRVRLARLALR